MNTKNSPCNERFEPSFKKGLRDEWEKEVNSYCLSSSDIPLLHD